MPEDQEHIYQTIEDQKDQGQKISQIADTGKE